MIRVYTNTRHEKIIDDFLSSINLEHEIFTIKNMPKDELKPFDLGISYSFPRKIPVDVIKIPSKGFVNYHAAPLPEYKGWRVYQEAIEKQELNWGVSLHYIDEFYDTGPIIKVIKIKLHCPGNTKQEIGGITNWFKFHLFIQSVEKLYSDKLHAISQKIDPDELIEKNL